MTPPQCCVPRDPRIRVKGRVHPPALITGSTRAASAGNDVMEICARLDALEETQEMLLDSFVDGERRLRWNPATAPRRAEPPISPYRLLSVPIASRPPRAAPNSPPRIVRFHERP